MATWTRGEEITKKVVYRVPAPNGKASWTQVQDAIHGASAELFRLNGAHPSDDSIWVTPDDDEILVWFEEPGHCASCDGASCGVVT